MAIINHNGENNMLKIFYNHIVLIYNAFFGLIAGIDFNKFTTLVSLIVMLVINSKKIELGIFYIFTRFRKRKNTKNIDEKNTNN
jgi:hypothetical protein